MTEEYCIWTLQDGQMDTSTNWSELFDLVNKQKDYKTYHIIPTRSAGKGEFRSAKQINESYQKALAKNRELLND